MQSTPVKKLLKRGAVLLMAVSAVAIVHAQTQSPGDTSFLPKIKPKSSYLKAPRYSGPPLSTALPTSGAFSGGLGSRGLASSGQRRPPVPRGASRIPTPITPRRNIPQFSAPQPYLPLPSITGRSISRYAITRGITTGLNF